MVVLTAADFYARANGTGVRQDIRGASFAEEAGGDGCGVQAEKLGVGAEEATGEDGRWEGIVVVTFEGLEVAAGDAGGPLRIIEGDAAADTGLAKLAAGTEGFGIGSVLAVVEFGSHGRAPIRRDDI